MAFAVEDKMLFPAETAEAIFELVEVASARFAFERADLGVGIVVVDEGDVDVAETDPGGDDDDDDDGSEETEEEICDLICNCRIEGCESTVLGASREGSSRRRRR